LIKETKIGARIFAHTLYTLTLCGCFDYQQPLSDTPTSRSLIQEATINDVPFNAWFSEENFYESPAGISFLNKVEEDPEFVGKTWLCKREILSNRICSAVAYDGFLEIARESKPIPQNESRCTPEVCSVLFEAKFSKLAKVYEHEGD
jgi:hypothetical protein